MPQTITYIRLSNFAPSENKYRMYAIAIEQQTSEQKSEYTVYLSWGRVSSHKRQQEYQFTHKQDMLKCLQRTLHKRHLHGYTILEKSNEFPQVKALEQLQRNRGGEQLSLFYEIH